MSSTSLQREILNRLLKITMSYPSDNNVNRYKKTHYFYLFINKLGY